MAHVYIDEVVVDAEEFRVAKSGDITARRRIAFELDNYFCSEHQAQIEDDQMIVSLRELAEAGVLEGIIIKTRSK